MVIYTGEVNMFMYCDDVFYLFCIPTIHLTKVVWINLLDRENPHDMRFEDTQQVHCVYSSVDLLST